MFNPFYQAILEALWILNRSRKKSVKFLFQFVPQVERARICDVAIRQKVEMNLVARRRFAVPWWLVAGHPFVEGHTFRRWTDAAQSMTWSWALADFTT